LETQRTIVIVPGFNEPDKDMNTLAKGRRARPGLEHRGFRCVTPPPLEEDLPRRIDHFAGFLTQLANDAATQFPVTTLGYSLGGLVVRGFLRRYPDRAREVEHTIQLGTPNWGITADILPMLVSFLRLKDEALCDLDLRSEFMRWLNGTSGHWVGRGKDRNWFLDEEPWIAPPASCLFSMYGVVPRFGGDNDGIVWKDSATLGSRIESREIKAPTANHLNLIGAWNLGTLLIKGFFFDDRVWPRCVEAIADHIEAPGMLCGAPRE
jgi:pimeloyl-ACP methyl ester carboxylesterase